MGKTIGTTTTTYLYDGANIVQELDGSPTPVATANLLTGLGLAGSSHKTSLLTEQPVPQRWVRKFERCAAPMRRGPGRPIARVPEQRGQHEILECWFAGRRGESHS